MKASYRENGLENYQREREREERKSGAIVVFVTADAKSYVRLIHSIVESVVIFSLINPLYSEVVSSHGFLPF